ncbi:MAG: ACP S-malonyltransferase [Candidatus Glassbacteria bacterium]
MSHRKKVVLMFPGQGAQYVGMAKSLYDNFDMARGMIDRADEVLETDLSRVMFQGPPDELKLTKNTQPAIFLHSAVIVKMLEPFPFEVGAACGHSLGEYTALYAAGSLSFEDSLWLVRERGMLMYESGKRRAGTMAAVMGLDAETVERICRESSDSGVVRPANFNCPGQIVVSGDVESVRSAMEKAQEAGAMRVIRLDVSGAFHSPLMEDASSGLEKRLASIEVQDAAFPIISNATALPVSSEADIKNALIMQLTSPVRWEESMRKLLEMGYSSFLELGPGRVLSGLLKRVDRYIEVTNVDKADDLHELKTKIGV